MNRSLGALAALAVGWIALTFQLFNSQSSLDVVLTLAALVLSECLSAVLVAVALSFNSSRQDALAGILVGWTLMFLGLIAAFHLDLLYLFQGQPFLLLSIVGLALILALLKLSEPRSPSTVSRRAIPLRLIIAAGAAYICEQVGVLGTDVIIISILGSYLVLLAINTDSLLRQPIELGAKPDTLSAVLLRYGDLLLMPVLISVGPAMIYLFARGMSMGVVFALGKLGENAAQALTFAGRQRDKHTFIRMAAQLNLGFLLIGGAVALAIVTLGTYLEPHVFAANSGFEQVMIWAVFGAAVPAIFGATDSLLKITGNGATLGLTNTVALVLFVVSAIASPEISALILAQMFAAAQFAKAAISAAILAQAAGIWPGLTAVLQRQIKLF